MLDKQTRARMEAEERELALDPEGTMARRDLAGGAYSRKMFNGVRCRCTIKYLNTTASPCRRAVLLAALTSSALVFACPLPQLVPNVS